MDRTPVSIWDNLDTPLPLPGEVPDLDHGIPGEAERLPDGDADREEDMT